MADVVEQQGPIIGEVKRYVRYRDMGDGTHAEVISGPGSGGAVTVSPSASEVHLGQVGASISNPSANFTRPNDTTAYASGDLVANSTTAGSVTALSFTATRVAAGSVMLRNVKVAKSGTSLTNASFRLHLYSASPTPSNGDNGAWTTSGVADYLGSFDCTMDRAFTDGASGRGTPTSGYEIAIKLASGSTVYGLLEARAAYTPTSGETFTVTLDAFQD